MKRPSPPPWPRSTEAALVLGFWTVLGALALIRRSLDPRGPVTTGPGALIVTLAEYGVWAALTPAVFAITRRVRFEAGARLRRGLMYLAIALAAAIVVEAVRQTLFFTFSRMSSPAVVGAGGQARLAPRPGWRASCSGSASWTSS